MPLDSAYVAPAAQVAQPVAPRRCGASDMERQLKSIATVEGAYSYALTSTFVATARTLSPPYQTGIVGITAARILYGSSWTAALLLDIGIASLFSGGDWCWVREATYRTDLQYGLTIPSGCDSFAQAGCGLGMGTFSELRVRVNNTRIPIWLGISGGWIQGRHDIGVTRSLVDATWVLSPISVETEYVYNDNKLSFRFGGGFGVFGGMHNAHVHPMPDHRAEVDSGPFEIVPYEWGAGLGSTLRFELNLRNVFSLHGQASLAPMPIHESEKPGVAWLQPMDSTRGDSMLTWRRFSAGLTFDQLWPGHKVGLETTFSELSSRKILSLGHKAIGLRVEIPLRTTLP